MTRYSGFPAWLRRTAFASVLLIAFSSMPSSAGAAPSAAEVSDAKAKVQQLRREMQAQQERLGRLRRRLQRANAEADRQETRLDSIQAQVTSTQQRIDAAQERYDAVIELLNRRAIQAFVDGPGTELEVILGATSLAELSDRLQFSNVVAENDARIALEVSNAKTMLVVEKDRLVKLEVRQRGLVSRAQAVRDAIYAGFRREQQLTESLGAKRAEAAAIYRKLYKDRKKYLDYINSLPSNPVSGGHDPVPIPAGYSGIFEYCPVAGPNSFSDGFGAPRYVGGFHLHAGNDMMAATGVPIVAPFDGTARSSWNTLGGNSVHVYGARGYVYNAHLSAFSSHSNGAVKAGDVIGYVGETGDAVGSHDHFEFHPAVMPSTWPASSYGYSIVGSAVNPYPLLVQACG